ncbi:MAG TPA: N-acetylneuraminate synthase family protein [Saccharofermentans sp.]|nr:N-acetylneuraminate synthase family protein [Saccharofermentans sp.]
MKKTYVIAEIGINFAHGPRKDGFLKNALDLIYMAKQSGFDAVKFQKREPSICVPEHQKDKPKEVPWRKNMTTYFQYKEDIEFGFPEYSIIADYCKDLDIDWSASVWDLESARFMKRFNPKWIKIPSALLTDIELIKHCYQNFDHLMLSNGMSTEDELFKAVDSIMPIVKPVTLFHCNSSYPAPVGDLNLSYICAMQLAFDGIEGISLGYSGHEYGLATSIASIYLGATYVERHITLDKNLWGSDQMASVEPQGCYKLVKAIRDLEKAFGDGKKKVTDDEKKKRLSLRGY